MQPVIQVLKSKIRPPMAMGAVPRKRLYPLLSKIGEKALTVVAAGAGFGKSTLIAQAGQVLQLKTAWYRLEKSDNDFRTLLTYWIAAVQTCHPQFGRETLLKMESSEQSAPAREALLTSLLNEMETGISDGLMLVLDDYHLVKDSPEIKPAMTFILNHLPPKIHLVIISRTEPGLPLSRLRAARQVVDITEADLAFSFAETKTLYADWAGPALAEEQLKIVHHRTNGWISGLILFYHSIQDQEPEKIREFFESSAGGRFVSNYLEENVYAQQPRPVRHFLARAAILSRMGPEFCDSLLGLSSSRGILENLEKNHLFTACLDEGREWFAFHHLFQEFLLTKLKADLSTTAIRALHLKAAGLWEQNNDPDQALQHYLKAHAFETAAALLTRMGRDYLREGRIQLLLSFIQQMPEQILREHPWLFFSKAAGLEFLGKREESVSFYKQALGIFQEQSNRAGEGKTLFALATYYYTTGDFAQAEAILQELLAKTDETPQLCVDTLGSLTFIAAHQGRMRAADGYIARAEALLPRLPSQAGHVWLYFNQGFRHCFAGDFAQGLVMGKKIETIGRKYGLESIRAYNYHLISWSYYHLGDFDAGLENARAGLILVQVRGYLDLSRAWLLTDAALNHLGLARLAEARANIQEAIAIFRDQGSRWGESWALHVLFDILRAGGEMPAAEQCLHEGLERIQGLKLPLQEGMLKKRLLICLQEKGLTKAAPALQADLDKLLKNTRLYFGGPRKHLPINAVLKDECSESKPALRIHLLGQFRLFQGAAEIPLERWKSKKALMIFKYLAARHGHGYQPKEVLMEILWPEQPPEQTNSRLNDALSALRKTLEPSLGRGAPSSYLLRLGYSYKLDLQPDGTVDVELFEQKIRTAENEQSAHKALACYLAAENLYQGDFLTEDRYSEWCLSERERLGGLYFRLLTRIMDLLEQKRDYLKAAAYGEKLLQADPYAEEIYQRLMRHYAELGNRSMVIRTFEKCRKMLTQDLAVALSPQTVALHARLISE